MSLSYCKAAKDTFQEIFNWLLTQPEVKEETLSDWLLYDLDKKIPTMSYKQFSRHFEGGKTGADWEIWILFPSTKVFKARIQAKKIKIDGDNYPGIAYSNANGLQIDMLIEDATLDQHGPFAPLYVFYSTEITSGLCRGSNNAVSGVYVAHAETIRSEFINTSRRRLNGIDVLERSHPFSCMFCCGLLKNINYYDGLKAFWENYVSVPESGIDANSGFGIDTQLPDYVTQLLAAKGEMLKYENANRPSERLGLKVGSLIVFDLRQED